MSAKSTSGVMEWSLDSYRVRGEWALVSTQSTNLPQKRYKRHLSFWILSIVRLQLELYSFNGFQKIPRCSRPRPSSRSWYEPIFQHECWHAENDLASPSQVRSTSCDFLEPIKADLIENFFDNECGDTVSFYFHIMSIYLKTLKAHGALRLAFHDAIGFSPKLG